MNSIYEYLNPNKKLWNKNISLKINPIDIIDIQNLKIKLKFIEEYQIKKFILTKDYLFFLNKNIKKFINLDFVGIKFSKKELKIVFFNQKKYFNLYFYNFENFHLWLKILKRKCILNNFSEDYKLIKLLGKGNYSKVFKAVNLKNNNIYAIKIINKDILNKMNFKLMINEILIMRNLNHKNIVKLKYVYETNQNFYLVWEYCNSFNLSEFLINNIEKINKFFILEQIINGVNYLHSKNIVHRDLKLENIFLKKDKENQIIVKIGDFTFSNFLNKPFISKICGTPGYMAPEILNYNHTTKYSISKKVDIYSLGHIIYNIFTDLYLFQTEDLEKLFFLNKQNLFTLNKNLNSKLKFLILNCLRSNPKRRFDIKLFKNFFFIIKFILINN